MRQPDVESLKQWHTFKVDFSKLHISESEVDGVYVDRIRVEGKLYNVNLPALNLHALRNVHVDHLC